MIRIIIILIALLSQNLYSQENLKDLLSVLHKIKLGSTSNAIKNLIGKKDVQIDAELNPNLQPYKDYYLCFTKSSEVLDPKRRSVNYVFIFEFIDDSLYKTSLGFLKLKNNDMTDSLITYMKKYIISVYGKPNNAGQLFWSKVDDNNFTSLRIKKEVSIIGKNFYNVNIILSDTLKEEKGGRRRSALWHIKFCYKESDGFIKLKQLEEKQKHFEWENKFKGFQEFTWGMKKDEVKTLLVQGNWQFTEENQSFKSGYNLLGDDVQIVFNFFENELHEIQLTYNPFDSEESLENAFGVLEFKLMDKYGIPYHRRVHGKDICGFFGDVEAVRGATMWWFANGTINLLAYVSSSNGKGMLELEYESNDYLQKKENEEQKQF